MQLTSRRSDISKPAAPAGDPPAPGPPGETPSLKKDASWSAQGRVRSPAGAARVAPLIARLASFSVGGEMIRLSSCRKRSGGGGEAPRGTVLASPNLALQTHKPQNQRVNLSKLASRSGVRYDQSGQ